MKKISVIIAVAALGAGCAEVRSTMRTGEPSGNQPTSQTAPRDMQLIDALVAHNQEAIELSRLADERASAMEVKSIASHVERDDAEELTRMQAYRTMWYGARARQPGTDIAGADALTEQEIAQLRGLVGNEFDRMFVDKMIEHHQAGLAMADEVQRTTQRDELREIAGEMIEEQRSELELLRQWQGELGQQGQQGMQGQQGG